MNPPRYVKIIEAVENFLLALDDWKLNPFQTRTKQHLLKEIDRFKEEKEHGEEG